MTAAVRYVVEGAAAPARTDKANAGGNRDRRRVIAVDAAEFLAMDFPPRECLLDPILPKQGLVMLHGPRGLGKTHLHMGMCVAVASAGEFLGWKAKRAAGVAIIDGELPAALLQERVARAIAMAGVDLIAPLRVVTPDLQPDGTPNLADYDWQNAIEERLDGIELIVVDNVSTLVRGGRENESEGWSAAQEWSLLQRARGRSVLWVHHSGKGGDQRGTSRREDVLDTVMAMRRPTDYEETEGCRFELHFTKHRGFFGPDAEPIEARLEDLPGDNFKWAWGRLESALEVRIAELHRLGMTVRDIATELGVSKSQIHRRMKAAGIEVSHGN